MEVAMPSRKPQKAVHSTDPGQSAWWLLAPVSGVVAGASIPYFATHSTAWATGGGAIGAAVGAAAAATPQLRDWVSARSRRRQIAESVGAATNISKEPLESLRVHSSDRDITEFVPRDIQNQLVEHLNNGTPVLIEGPSMSGKTRLALETIRSHWPEAPFWFPRDDGDIEQLLSSSQQPAPHTVILLDDLDRFLSNQSLTLGLLNQWTKNSCIIIATMMHSQYVKHSDRTNEKFSGWDTINRFKKITLTPSLSANELKAVKLTSYAKQLSQIESIGLGPLLGCAEAVRIAFADEIRDHSWCGTLITAAADWRRIGLGPASKEQLISFSKAHKDNAKGTFEWDSAWKHATKPINNTVPLLRQVGDDRWEVLDIIADEADWKISTNILSSLASIPLSTQQALQSALTMTLQGDPHLPTTHMFDLAIEADPDNAYALGSYAIFLYTSQRDIYQAEQIFRKAIKLNFNIPAFLGTYAYFLQHELNDMDQSEDMYQQAITADLTNATNLGNYALFLETVRHNPDQAEDMYQQAITADLTNARNLGNYALFLETVRHNPDQAEDMYQQAIDADPTNATNLGNYATFLCTKRGDMDQAEDMYQQAIDADPTNATNLGNYATFLCTKRGDMDQAEDMYQQAIDADPTNAKNLGNYATFLKNIRGDMKQAQHMYQQAITADPNNARNLGNYATFLHTVLHDPDQAGHMYQQAIDADPTNAKNLGNYALFLHTFHHDQNQTQHMYQRAVTADPTNARILGNYATFLYTKRGDMDQAEDMYQQAVTADPTNARNLGNYALFLETTRGDMDQAENMYQQAIALDSHHARNLGNYALFLETIRGDIDQAQHMYQQAIEANPNNATNLGNYALFLETMSGDMDQAQYMYQQAIEADPTNTRNLGNCATFLHTVRGDMDQAQKMYHRAITADPHHANNLGNYAQLLFVKSDNMKAIILTEKAITLANDDERSLLAECHFYLFAHSPEHRKESGRTLKKLLADGVTTGDWSFEMNLERLRSEDDPRLNLLEAVARTLGDGDMSRLNAFEEWRDL